MSDFQKERTMPVLNHLLIIGGVWLFLFHVSYAQGKFKKKKKVKIQSRQPLLFNAIETFFFLFELNPQQRNSKAEFF